MAVLLRTSFINATLLTNAAKRKTIFTSKEFISRNSIKLQFTRQRQANSLRPRTLRMDATDTMQTDKELIANVLRFWFGSNTFPPYETYESQKGFWYGSSKQIDDDIRSRFGRATDEAISGKLDHWIGNTEHGFKSDLALVVMLDQFPRNIYRGSSKAFSGDTKSKTVIEHLIGTGGWGNLKHYLSPVARLSFLLALMHQESLDDQDRCIELTKGMIEECKVAGKQAEETTKILHESLKFAQLHRDIIEQFGRFPHRNDALSRLSTPEEERYLVDGPRFGQ